MVACWPSTMMEGSGEKTRMMRKTSTDTQNSTGISISSLFIK